MSDRSQSSSDDEERAAPATTGKYKSAAIVASSDDSDASDAPKSSKKRPAASESDEPSASATQKRKAPRLAGSDVELDSDELMANERATGHPDGYDSELLGDKDDRKRMADMTEKEREAEIFKRLERREFLNTRLKIKKRLSKASRNRDFSSDASEGQIEREKPPRRRKGNKKSSPRAARDSDDSDDDFATEMPHQRREKQGKATAMQKLQDARKKKADTAAATAAQKRKDFNKVFGDSSSEESSASDRNDDRHDNRSAFRRATSDSDDSDRSDEESRRKAAEDEEKRNTPISSLAHVEQMKFSRMRLSMICHASFFEKTVKGGFVRVGIGINAGQQVYRLGEVIAVVQTAKTYDLERTRTDLGLRVRVATEERVFRMNFVSNSPVTESEFRSWLEKMRVKNCHMPSLYDAESKKADIDKAKTYQYSEAELDDVLKEKKKFRQAPTNYAVAKTKLWKEIDEAESVGDVDKVYQLRMQLGELDDRADSVKHEREESIKGVSWINQRNRSQMRATDTSEEIMKEMKTNQMDPFTRKSGNTIMRRGKKKEEKEAEAAAQAAGTSEVLKTEMKPKIEDTLDKSVKHTLHSLHDFDIDIQLDMEHKPEPGAPVVAVATAPTPLSGGRRSLNLDEYKRKRGLI